MDCRESRSLIYSYIDGELSQEEAFQIEAHLKDCPECEGYYQYQYAFKCEIKNKMVICAAPEVLRERITGKVVKKEGYSLFAYRGFATAAVAFLLLFAISPSFMGYTTLSDQNRDDYVKTMQVFSNNQQELALWVTKNSGHKLPELKFNEEMFPMTSLGAFIQPTEDRSGLFYHYKGERVLYKRLLEKPSIECMNTYKIGEKSYYFKQDGAFYHIYWKKDAAYYGLISRLPYEDVQRMIQAMADR